jgi:hypothetical protein
MPILTPTVARVPTYPWAGGRPRLISDGDIEVIVTAARTRTWKESTDPDRDAKLDRIEYVTSACPDRCFAFDQDYLRWRNAHARHPGVLAAQRRERARIRSERQQRWGRPKPKAA